MSILDRLFGRPDDPPPDPDAAGKGGSDTPLTLSDPISVPPAGAQKEAPPHTNETQAKQPARPKTISRPQPRSDRIKTRLMSYGQLDAVLDEMDMGPLHHDRTIARPVGWLVIIEGPGTGGWYTLESGLTRIGRGSDQNVRLNFGDDSISRSGHASITYEPREHRFRLGLGRSQNEVLLNGKIISDNVALQHGDRITIGETTLRFAAFCDDHFSWAPIIDRGTRNVLSA